MSDVRHDYARQVELERLLNADECDGMPLGELLVDEIREALGGTSTFTVRPYLVSFASLVVKAIRKPVEIPDLKATVIYFRSGNLTHHQAIERSVKSGLKGPESMTVLRSGGAGDFHVRDALQCLRPRDVVVAVKQVTRSRRHIRACVARAGESKSVANRFSAALFAQFLRARGLESFLRTQSETRFLSADFDRGALTAPLFLAARRMNLPSGSIQHGALLPAETLSGFTPLIADTIGVWGTAVRDQLIKEGEPPESVVVVGCPTLRGGQPKESGSTPATHREVYLALSEPDIFKERQVVSFFLKIAEGGASRYGFKVKLHPGRDRSAYQWISDDFGIDLVPEGVPIEQFAASAAAVLITGSSLGLSMLSSGVRVGVVDIPEAASKMSRDYVNYLKVPAVGSVEDFDHLMSNAELCDGTALNAVMDNPNQAAFRTFLGLDAG